MYPVSYCADVVYIKLIFKRLNLIIFSCRLHKTNCYLLNMQSRTPRNGVASSVWNTCRFNSFFKYITWISLSLARINIYGLLASASINQCLKYKYLYNENKYYLLLISPHPKKQRVRIVTQQWKFSVTVKFFVEK